MLMNKKTITSLAYESPTTNAIIIGPAQCIADSTARSQLQTMDVEELYDESF